MVKPHHRAKEPFIGGLDVHIFEFENGLTLKVVPDHSAPVVAYQTWYGVGSADEREGKTGLAHLFEHMMFKGTETYAEGEYSARLEALGASGLNAWTWLDQTVFVQSIPAAYFGSVAELESIRMTRLVIDQSAFESELEVVTNERLLVVDNDPDGLLNERLFANAFEVHSYGWPTVGWKKDLDNMCSDDARAFYTDFYAPNNATIFVVGDIKPEDAAAVIHKNYGHIPRSEPQRPLRRVEAVQRTQKREDLTLAMSSDRVLIGFKIPKYTDLEIPALLVLDAALTSGRTGRLQRALRDGGWVADVSSYIMPLRDPSLWEFSLQCRSGLPADIAEGAFWKEIERVAEEGVGEGEVQMGIAQWRSFTWSQMVGVDGKADFLGWLCVHTGSHKDGLNRITAMENVKVEDVQAVAKKWLVKSQATVVVGHAEGEEATEELPTYRRVVPAERLRIVARDMGNESHWKNGEERVSEVCGATVICTYDSLLPLIYFNIKLRCGAALDPVDRRGLANLTGLMLSRGTKQRNRLEFEAALEQLGASMSVAINSDSTSIWGSCLSDNWPVLVQLVSEALQQPLFELDDLELLKSELREELLSVIDDDEELAEIALSHAMYGDDHPYGRDPRGTIEGIDAISVADINAFYERNIKCQGGLVGVVGAFDDSVAIDVRQMLQCIEGTPAERIVWPDLPSRAVARTIFVDKPERSQCQVRIGQPGLQHMNSEFPAFVLANDCFGVGFQSRLMQEIRVKSGWSYFAYSSPSLGVADTAWSVGFAPGNENAVKAVARVFELLDTAKTHGFESGEVEQMRQARLKGAPFLMDTPIKRLDLRLQKEWMGYDRLATNERMKTLSLDELDRAFKQTLSGQFVTVVVGTWEAIGPQIGDLFEGPIERIPFRDLIHGGT